MTKFDIFVVNLGCSVDRREAMKRKIAKIRGFKAIYIDNELVIDSANPQNLNKNNSSLRADSQNLRGNPPIKKTQKSQSGLPRTTSCARNDDSFLDSAIPPPPNSHIFSQKGCTPHPAPPTRQKLPLFAFRGRASLSPLLAKNQLFHYCSLESDFLHHEAGEIRCASHDSLELHFHFFPATDATKFKNGESPLPPQYSSKLTRFVKGKDLSFGEIAIFSSSYRLWQKCVELDSPIIVLEDDIDFMQDFCQIIEIFKSPFEYVRLRYTIDKKIIHLHDRYYISFDRIAGAQGYYLTPQAAQKFIKNARFWLFCVDDYMDMFFIHSVKNIIFKPFIISEDSLSAWSSTILGREKPKMRFYQKLTRELSRIYFFVIRKYVYFALHCVELRAFFRANRRW